MKKLIDIPEPSVNKLKKIAKKRRMRVKPLIETIVIEYAQNETNIN